MICDGPANTSPCPCATPEFPVEICNPAGQPVILYRTGDYLAFREKLLRPLTGETQLTAWQPGAAGDLAVQMVEWWAYLADILTFYNERIANEAYLGTAILPESVNHLVQLLGYRPRPALGAKVTLAGLLTPKARLPVALPQGLQVQSKPGPNLPPQIFELDSQSTLTAPDIISADVIPNNQYLLANPGSPASGSNTVWLAGKITSIKTGDNLLLINPATLQNYAWINVASAQPATDPLGNTVTAVNFSPVFSNLPADAGYGGYVLLRSGQSSPLWSYPVVNAEVIQNNLEVLHLGAGGTARREELILGGSAPEFHLPVVSTTINLGGLARAMTPGSLFLLDIAGSTSPAPTALAVESYAENFWYANGDGPAAPAVSATLPPAIGIPVSSITVPPLGSAWTGLTSFSNVTARYGFTRAGTLVPVLGTADYVYPAGGTNLAPLTGSITAAAAVLLEDANGNATNATLSPGGAGGTAISPVPEQAALTLASPIDVLFNLLPFSRGKTVPLEVLGSGNPSVAGQDFPLKNMPVTYFADPASISGDGYSSTVQVSVNNTLWTEKQSFYGQPANAQIYVLREDDAGQTHVTFGDGVNGALLPTGANNIIASYRYGAGAAVPAAETLTVVQTPQPGLKAIRNPLQPTGGNDADSPARLRSLAPQSVLTFNRAVSLDDYAAIALTAAGVNQAVAGYVFDPLSQRPAVTLWVAGDPGAVIAVNQALAGTMMPGQGVSVQAATAVNMLLTLSFVCDSSLDAPAIQTALTTALTDPDAGLFGSHVIGIGQVIYNSQIEAKCLQVPGVLAVHGLRFSNAIQAFTRVHYGVFRRPGVFWKFSKANACAGNRYDPGAGNYFVIERLNINPEIAVPV